MLVVVLTKRERSNRQTNKQTDRKRDRQTDMQIEEHEEMAIVNLFSMLIKNIYRIHCMLHALSATTEL